MTTVTINTLQAKKEAGEKFTCIAAYDATFASLISQAGVDIILVGDSLGMVLQGHDSTLPVTVADMAYHTACVSRGNQGALVLADMPFMAYGTTEQALDSAAELMRAGGHMVKLEGGQWLSETISQLVERGIPVCAHLGLTPQSVNKLGGYRVQGRQPEQAEQIIADSLAVEAAGASLLVLECVPSALGKTISEKLRIPTIGIGAGPDTDAQVLVLHDMLGLNPRPAKFVKDFMAGQGAIEAALKAYVSDVRDGRFPGPEHGFE